MYLYKNSVPNLNLILPQVCLVALGGCAAVCTSLHSLQICEVAPMRGITVYTLSHPPTGRPICLYSTFFQGYSHTYNLKLWGTPNGNTHMPTLHPFRDTLVHTTINYDDPYRHSAPYRDICRHSTPHRDAHRLSSPYSNTQRSSPYRDTHSHFSRYMDTHKPSPYLETHRHSSPYRDTPGHSILIWTLHPL